MDEKKYIEKWLQNELTPSEQAHFESQENFADIIRIENAAKRFKAPSFDLETSYQNFKQLKTGSDTGSSKWKMWLIRVAAILIVALASYIYLNATGNDITIETIAANRQEVLLPDTSQVILNAKSSLHYNKKSWKTSREVHLTGEAYFKVAKGQRFDVKTTVGTVSVLGTQFNIKNRNNLLKVACYEGLVRVDYDGVSYKVPAGHTFVMRNNDVSERTTTLAAPEWTENKSAFDSAPYGEVLAELERQYDVEIINKSIIDKNLKFTGNFIHTDRNTALKSVTIPVDLKFSIKNRQVTLSK